MPRSMRMLLQKTQRRLSYLFFFGVVIEKGEQNASIKKYGRGLTQKDFLSPFCSRLRPDPPLSTSLEWRLIEF